MENHGRRMAHGDPHTVIMKAAIALFSVCFHEAVVQHVSYVTDFVEF